jgi:XRE family transcriptional regulator, stress-response regulator
MILLRRVIGDALRARRLAQQRTLREVSTEANVSLGYLSEIERGHKEASSELLASICDALGANLSDLLNDVSAGVVLAEQLADAVADVPVEASPVVTNAVAGSAVAGSVSSRRTVTEDGVTVAVHHDGPLRTTLTTRRDRQLVG